MTSSAASAQPTSERWEGSGVVYSIDGKELETYKVATNVFHPSVNSTRTETILQMADGTSKTIAMSILVNGDSFSTQSNLGNGGGACYGEGLCENYIKDENGRSYATTIIQDAAGSRRHLTIIMDNGKAIKVLREKVMRAN